MAVTAELIEDKGAYLVYRWVLTSADQDATGLTGLGAMNEKTISVDGASDAAGFNGATLELQGRLHSSGAMKLLNSVPDTQDLSFTAASAKAFTVLPNVTEFRPVITAGTVGATGVTVYLLLTSGGRRVS